MKYNYYFTLFSFLFQDLSMNLLCNIKMEAEIAKIYLKLELELVYISC